MVSEDVYAEEEEMIRKSGSGYKVFSEKGKPLSKVLSRRAAEKRLQQVEYFKRKEAVKGLK